MRLSETDRRGPVWAMPLMAAAAVASVLVLGDRTADESGTAAPEGTLTLPTGGEPAVTAPAVDPVAGAGTLVDLAGVGTATSAQFRPGGEWLLAWAFDCSQASEAAAGFNVTLLPDGADPVPAVDQTRRQASGVERLTVAGPLRLRLAGECPWTVQVHG